MSAADVLCSCGNLWNLTDDQDVVLMYYQIRNLPPPPIPFHNPGDNGGVLVYVWEGGGGGGGGGGNFSRYQYSSYRLSVVKKILLIC